MTGTKWPLNGTGTAAVGAVLAALLTLFAFLNGVPWERKGAAAELRYDIQQQLSEIKQDVREIREWLRRGR